MAPRQPYGQQLEEEEPPRLPSASPAPQGFFSAPQAQAQQRAAPTNFVNFQRRFNANADVAKREAGKYAKQAQGAADTAGKSLGAAQQTFANGVNTGTVQAPGGGPSTNTGAGAPKTATLLSPPLMAAPMPVAPPPVSNSQPLTGDSTRPPGSTSQSLTGDSTRPNAGPTMAEMLAKAGQQYTGPAGLEHTEQAAIDAEAAQQQLDGLKDGNGIQALVNDSPISGSQGADRLSGSLIGSAGRADFDALRAKFNPNKDLLDAQAKAVKTAKQAKTDSDVNAQAWGDKAKAAAKTQAELDAANTSNDASAKARRDADQKERASRVPQTEQEAADPMFGVDKSNPDEVKARTEEFGAYTKAMSHTGNDDINNAFEDFNSVASPVNWVTNAAGVRDPGQDYETKNSHGGSGSASGGTNGRNIDWASTGMKGFYVWRQMTPSDWAALNKLPRNGPNSQGAWVQKKFAQLTADQKTKNNAAAAAPKYGTSKS